MRGEEEADGHGIEGECGSGQCAHTAIGEGDDDDDEDDDDDDDEDEMVEEAVEEGWG